jgi:hypothetical protein
MFRLGKGNLIKLSLSTAGIIDTGSKFTGSVVDVYTGGKFSTGVVDTDGEPVVANICENFCNKFEIELNDVSGGRGKVIHEKKIPEVNNLVTLSFHEWNAQGSVHR